MARLRRSRPWTLPGGARIRDGRLWGCLFVGADKHLPRRRWLQGLFAADALDGPAHTSLLAGRPPQGRKDGGETVCACFNVGLNSIVDAIQEEGLTSVDAIGASLQAGTNCGSCLPELTRILREQP